MRFRAHALVVFMGMFLFLMGCPSGGGGTVPGEEGSEDGNPASCAGNCDDQAPAGCWCDEECGQFDDCCDDYDEVCGGGEETDIITGEGNASEILEHDFPESLVAGEISTAFVTVLNKGEHVWTAEDGYRLGAMGDQDPFADSVRMYLPDDVEVLPGDSWAFEILLTAPDVSGKYQTGWKMVQEHVEWFGHQVIVDVMVACVEDPAVEPVVPLDVPLCGADSSSFAPPFVDP